MKIVFLGSAHFGIPSLEGLCEAGYKISCVVTQPDKHGGRGLPMLTTPVKQFALEHGLAVYQPERANSPEAISFLKNHDADIFIVIAYGQILSTKFLELPRIMTVNLHASLLPRYRGAAPINWALIRGEKTTGVTVMKVVREPDAGPVILQKETPIREEDTSLTLEERLSKLGGPLVSEAVRLIEAGAHTLNSQDPAQATLAPKLKKEDGHINWQRPAIEIACLVRGCLAWPGAFTRYRQKLLKIYSAQAAPALASERAPAAGTLIEISKQGLSVACGTGILVIRELQIESKRRMSAREFIAGHHLTVGDTLG